jgi:putative transposase
MEEFTADWMYALFEQFDIPPFARNLIVDSFRRPARDLQPNQYHAPLELPCPKMGLMIHVANALERKAANDYLFDESVRGYLDSPFELHVTYEGRGKRPVQFNWRQGFLVMKSAGFFLDDWYTLDSLLSQCKKNPDRFTREGNMFRCPPLEAAASRMKIVYRLRVGEEIDPVSDRNRDFLRSYLVDRESAPTRFIAEVNNFFKSNSFATLEELRSAFPERGVDLFQMAIATGQIVSDFSSAFIRESDRFMVFRDLASRDLYRQAYAVGGRLGGHDPARAEFRVGTRLMVLGNPFTISVLGNLDALLIPDDEATPLVMKVQSLHELWKKKDITILSSPDPADGGLCLASPLRIASTKAGKNAVEKLKLLRRWEEGDTSPDVTTAYSDRTYRTLRKIKRDAIEAHQDVLAALLPRWPDRGNRVHRLSTDVEKIIKDIFEKHFENLRGPNKWFVYGLLSTALEKIGEKVSKPTFLRRAIKFESVRTVEKREGRKAAYQASTFQWVIRRDTPVHGDYPMQFVHIDHTELNIEVTLEETGESLGRPVLTLIICAFSRRILGFYLSLRSPRYVSCMAAVLDMIRRFERAPEFVIFDGGAEFGSRDFKWLLRFLSIGEKPRKTSACREGDVIERVFGLSQEAFIHNLPGNTKLRTNPRQLTKSTDPSSLAEYTLAQLYDGLEKYFFEVYDKRRHGTLLMSPRQKFEIGMDRSGKRLGRLRRLEDCIPLAFPSVSGFSRKIDYQRGVHAKNSQFRNPRLETPQYQGVDAEVKYHPIDPNVIYAFVDKEWHPMLRVKTDADNSLSDSLSLAEFEERRILHSRTLASQSEANMAVANIVADMDRHSAERTSTRSANSASQAPNTSGKQQVIDKTADTTKPDKKNRKESSLAKQLRHLRDGGYHGKRYQ